MPIFKELYNKHKGETAIVIGNGPSLRNVPGEFLNEYPTFGSNKIYMLPLNPTYHVIVNPIVYAQFKEDKPLMTSIQFFPRLTESGAYKLNSVGVPMFSYCPWKWIYEGHTVTFVSLQLAFFMGFETVLLVGVDHRYEYEGEPNEERLMEGDDPNHFDPNYFKGHHWNNPDLERSEEAYEMALMAYHNDHRQIINLTEGSALDVFPKMEL